MKTWTALAVLATAALIAAGCGGGSDSGGSSGSGSASEGNQQDQRAELRDCLKEHGIELPEGGGPGGGGPGGGQPPADGEFPAPAQGQPPAGGAPPGGNNEELRKAIQECGGDAPQGGFGNRNSAEFRKSIQAYVRCVRRHGYDLPDPKLSGDGPAFDDSAVDRDDPKFQKASQRCQDRLRPEPPQN